MKLLEPVRTSLTVMALFLVVAYAPLACMAYQPGWYLWNCGFHDRCGELLARKGISAPDAARELTAFLAHSAPLGPQWNPRERQHLAEVRPMLDRLALAALGATLLLPWLVTRARLRRAAWINAGIALAAVVLLPFFPTFWRDVFHPLLFDNDLWRNTPAEISWYLMPRRVFFHITAVLIAVTFTVHLLLVLALGRPRPLPADG